jgi:hypothetical protein
MCRVVAFCELLNWLVEVYIREEGTSKPDIQWSYFAIVF